MGAITVRDMTEAEWAAVVDVAKGKREPDVVLSGGTVLNVYSAELIQANVWLVGSRIAYVGPRVYEGTAAEVIDVTGQVLVPGYIEPHAHPFQLYNPVSYASSILARGTTCSINDDLMLYMAMEFGQVGRFFEDMAKLPIKMLWSVRLDSQSHRPDMKHKFEALPLSRLLKSPSVWQAGEVTDWKSWIDGDPEMMRASLAAKEMRKKIEGHCAGASYETLNVLTAAGVTADHEAINAEDALRRLRLGIWTTLRHSSLRPDLPDILPGLIGELKNWNRVMMTTDGPTPEYLQDGYTDFILRKAMELGLDPITAYQLVTINPATYYGVDDQIGGIAPGRIADLLVLNDLREPTPQLVIADGQVVARDGELLVTLPEPNWAEIGLPPLQPLTSGAVSPDWFDIYTGGETIPALNLQNPAITRKLELPVRTEQGRVVDLVETSDDLCYLALLDRQGNWVCNGVIKSFATTLDGMASTYTGAGEIVVVGRDKQAMAAAVERVLELGGGIAVMERDEATEGDYRVSSDLPLTINGVMGRQSVDELVARSKEIAERMRRLGHPYYDVIYTLLFLSSTHLPELRLSPEGLFEVKTKRVLHPVRELGTIVSKERTI
ncbi:MAG TPA: adenine deaminase C-terminal domain-containing protein [Bacilli bacterium]|nr:adenine deaminase C-terminal domain-containing protein [Bacilli bacterium]